VNVLLAGLTAAVLAGAVVAVSAREARASLLGLLVVLLASSLLTDPLPGPLPLAARIAAALLAARLISISIRGLDRPTAGSRLGWPVEALAALAAGVVGFGTHGLGATPLGPALASAAFLFGLSILWETFTTGKSVPGYPSLMVGLMTIGGVQLLMIGIVGEYIGKILSELKARPIYFVAEHSVKRAEPDAAAHASKQTAAE